MNDTLFDYVEGPDGKPVYFTPAEGFVYDPEEHLPKFRKRLDGSGRYVVDFVRLDDPTTYVARTCTSGGGPSRGGCGLTKPVGRVRGTFCHTCHAAAQDAANKANSARNRDRTEEECAARFGPTLPCAWAFPEVHAGEDPRAVPRERFATDVTKFKRKRNVCNGCLALMRRFRMTIEEYHEQDPEWNGTCMWDGCNETENLEMDHVVPLSRGGRPDGAQQPLCPHHNRVKHNRIL